MSQQERKQKRIRKIIDDAAKALKDENVKFIFGVVDSQPKEENGGKVYFESDATGEDFCYIMKLALKEREDVVNMGIWIGQLLQSFK